LLIPLPSCVGLVSFLLSIGVSFPIDVLSSFFSRTFHSSPSLPPPPPSPVAYFFTGLPFLLKPPFQKDGVPPLFGQLFFSPFFCPCVSFGCFCSKWKRNHAGPFPLPLRKRSKKGKPHVGLTSRNFSSCWERRFSSSKINKDPFCSCDPFPPPFFPPPRRSGDPFHGKGKRFFLFFPLKIDEASFIPLFSHFSPSFLLLIHGGWNSIPSFFVIKWG